MWTRSGHLTAQTWAFAVARGFRHVYSPARLSEEQSSTLLITFDYFHLLGSVWLARTAGGLISYKSRCLCRTALCGFRISTPLLQPGIPHNRYCDTNVSPVNHYPLPFSLINYTSILTYLIFLKNADGFLNSGVFYSILGQNESEKNIFCLDFKYIQ